jgi:hypothetical protein
VAYQTVYVVVLVSIVPVAYPEIFFRGGSTNSVDRGQREQGSGGRSPLVTLNLQMGETCIRIRFLGCIFHRTGNSARLCQNFGII